MRMLLSALLVLSVFVLVTHITKLHPEVQDPVLYDYVIHNFEDDCRTSNAVTAILLNYRMYDTMFEVLILLTAIIGMKQFLPAPHELKDISSDKKGSKSV